MTLMVFTTKDDAMDIAENIETLMRVPTRIEHAEEIPAGDVKWAVRAELSDYTANDDYLLNQVIGDKRAYIF